MKVPLTDLELNGFFETETTPEDFLRLANNLGQPVPSRKAPYVIDTLKPKEGHKAHKNSLSNKFGIGQFPFHTDGAYFSVPPKFIILRYAEGTSTPTPTILLPLYSLLTTGEKLDISKEMWAVKGRTFNFYASPLERGLKGEEWLRYDLGCMSLLSKTSCMENFILDKIDAGFIKVVDWYVGKTLVLDNWKVLHARPAVKEGEVDLRTIQRIMVNE